MLDYIENRAKRAIRKTVAGGLGGVMVLVGLGFLTAALYMYLLTQMSALEACLCLGGGFVGVGLLTLGLSRASASKPKTAAHSSPAATMTAPMVLAFLEGVQQGMASNRPKPR